ncbi:GATA transcription factor [Striga asiatica]|uniref:GATA transcription factor n=1 Tax=Striga asiatica TaxID=4170 RepID=A0A5A7Q4Y1_STRAF|nr:GATA transcription factor [Striga asiatica]
MSVVEPGNCWDAISNCVLGDEEFDNILNILDFPLESLEEDGFVADWDISKSQCLGPPQPNELSGPPEVANTNINSGSPSHLLPGLSVPIGAQEQKPISSPGSHNNLQLNKSAEARESNISHTQSPVSVLESSGSCSASSKNPLAVSSNPIPTRARSSRHKRARTNPWPTPLSLFTSIPKKENFKKTEAEAEKLGVKKCMHCEVTKTPQWREGPLGPKTLCNACGVRYRSGRLLPEYRPAASPTFVPSLHSNLHKKVILMRNEGKKLKVKMEVESDHML